MAALQHVVGQNGDIYVIHAYLYSLIKLLSLILIRGAGMCGR